MDDRTPIGEFPPDADLTAIIVANSVPFVGLLAFGTSGSALVVFYWLEFTVLSVWALVRGIFAGKPPERDADRSTFLDTWGEAGIPVPGTSVKILYQTLPGLVFLVPLLAVVWAGFGGLVAGPVLAANPEAELPSWVLVGAAAVFVTEGGRTATEYLYRGKYKQTSVWMALRGVLFEGFVLAGLGLLVVVTADAVVDGKSASVEAAASGPLVLTAVVLKCIVDLTNYYVANRDESIGELI